MGGGQVEMRWGRGGREKDKKESSDCRKEMDKSKK